MRELWQYWIGKASDDFIEDVIRKGESYPVASAGVGFDGSTKNDGYRNSEIRWIPAYDPQNLNIVNFINHFAMEANRNAFGFIVDSIVDVQYTKYSATDNGHYGWHIDTFWANPTAYDRKISVVVQLSDPSEYEGGDFLIDKQYPQPDPNHIKQKGTVIVFPSFIPHCVTPVTKGERKSLVSWVQGPKFR